MKVSQYIYNFISKNLLTTYIYSDKTFVNCNKNKLFIYSCNLSTGFYSIGHNKSLNKFNSIIITSSEIELINIISSLTNAYLNNIPLFIISTNIYQKSIINLIKPICHWHYMIDNSNEIDHIMNIGLEYVKNNKQVHINIYLQNVILP